MLKSINPAKAEPKFPVRSVNIEENKSFTGREADLAKMHKYLIQDHVESRPVSCGLHGIGGVGKTQTALKFLYKYGDDFDAIFWVSADPEKGTEIQRTFGGIGVSLKLFDEDIEIGDQQINQVTQWLITAGKLTVGFSAPKIRISDLWKCRGKMAFGIRQCRES